MGDHIPAWIKGGLLWVVCCGYDVDVMRNSIRIAPLQM